jgi:hypothetical protein
MSWFSDFAHLTSDGRVFTYLYHESPKSLILDRELELNGRQWATAASRTYMLPVAAHVERLSHKSIPKGYRADE